mgnify:CR=1 FL=1
MGTARARYSVAERLEQFGAAVEARLGPAFDSTRLPYPPQEVALVAFKDSRMLEVYARHAGDAWRLVRTYPVLAASGEHGPKLKDGDRQVPEGVYAVESLNPNSRFHLSLRLNYPNDFDRRMARAEGRTDLGGDIMIHGGASSIGCLAMGDEAAEDLFVLAALVGTERVTAIISPTDFRRSSIEAATQPSWLPSLYEKLKGELRAFPLE